MPRGERQLIAGAILAKCDALDGLADGLVQDVEACRTAFNLERDVPTCPGPRDGSCLTPAQKTAVASAFAAARTSGGEAVYSSFPFDPGLVQAGWADWKFRSSVGNTRNPVSMGFIFSTPPSTQLAMATDTTLSYAYAVNFNLEAEYPKIFATNATYAESSMSFMTPPNPTRLDTLRNRGAKMIVVHGLSDGIFSPDDTAAWWRAVDASHGGASDFVRYFQVPGMGHSRGGPSTDQYDALTALVDWVEKGMAPDRIIATARGPGNAAAVNADVPASWSPSRSRPLCPYPLVARYKGGDVETAASFACER